MGAHRMARPSSTGTPRDDFLRRPVDYSARTRLVIAKQPNSGDRDAVPDPDTVLLGQDLALHLLAGWKILGETVRNHIAHAALTTGSLPLKPDDGLLLCDPPGSPSGLATTGWMSHGEGDTTEPPGIAV